MKTLAETLWLPNQASVEDDPSQFASWKKAMASELAPLSVAIKSGIVAPITLEQWGEFTMLERRMLAEACVTEKRVDELMAMLEDDA